MCGGSIIKLRIFRERKPLHVCTLYSTFLPGWKNLKEGIIEILYLLRETQQGSKSKDRKTKFRDLIHPKKS